MRNKIFYQDTKYAFYYDYIFFEIYRPIFFSCKDQNNQLYLTTLCDDRKEFRWIMVKTSENQLIDIMKNKLTMYEVYVNTDKWWIIKEKHGIKKCKIYTKEQVNELDFPTKREYFDADKDELKDYLSHIQNEKEYHMKKVKRNFCINCRKETDIMWGKAERTTNIKGKPFDYLETVAVCKECGQEMNPHGLIDLNIKELEEQYQKTYRNK